MADRDSRKGSTYADEKILSYLSRVHATHDEALEAAFSAPDREGIPAIQVAPLEGKLLALLVRLARAEKVVEVGTLAGYSAIHMARALPPGGRLYTIENEAAHADIARQSFERAGVADRIELLLGDALAILPGLESRGPFDVVFIDADKKSYDRYGAWAAANVRPGGLLVADNAFLFGGLLDDSDSGAAMRRFHEEAVRAFDTTCVPTPDGVLVGIRR
jgi:predicted O-methyltransferase YrrM